MTRLKNLFNWADYTGSLYGNLGALPDLVVIPLSFISRWFYDLVNESFADLEQRFAIQIEFLCCESIIC